MPATPPHAIANQLWTTWKPLAVGSAHGSSQIVDAVLHVGELRSSDVRADREQHGADAEVRGPLGGDPQHHDEQGEEQQRRAEVLLGDHDHDRRRPTPAAPGRGAWGRAAIGRNRGHVAMPSSSRFSTRYDAKKMASTILANSPGWKLIGPKLHPDAGAVDRHARRPAPAAAAAGAMPSSSERVAVALAGRAPGARTSSVTMNAPMPTAVHVACRPARLLAARRAGR